MLIHGPNKWKIAFFMASAVIGILLYIVLSQQKIAASAGGMPNEIPAGIQPDRRPVISPVETPEPTESMVYITRSGHRFHRGSCRYLSMSKISVTRAEAMDNGCSACLICQP